MQLSRYGELGLVADVERMRSCGRKFVIICRQEGYKWMDGQKQLILSKKSYTKIRRFEQTEDNKINLLKRIAFDSK